MDSLPLLDRARRRRLPATTSSFQRGLPPRNRGLRYPPDPPAAEEIIAVMRAAGGDPDGLRLCGVIVMLWRAGLRISEALSLNETDLDPRKARISATIALTSFQHVVETRLLGDVELLSPTSAWRFL